MEYEAALGRGAGSSCLGEVVDFGEEHGGWAGRCFSLLFKVGENETGSPWAQTGIRSQIEIPLFMLDIVDGRIIEEL